jgi:hypothetical protein
MSRNQCLLRYGLYSCGIRCPMWFQWISTQLSAFVAQRCALCRKFLLTFESHGRDSPLVVVIPSSHWSALNALKSLDFATTKNPEDYGQRIVQVSWLDLCILSTVHRKSGSGAVWQRGENEAVPHRAWTTCVVVDEEAHVPRVLVNHSPKYDCILAPVSLLGKKIGPKSWSPKMPTQTLTRPYLSAGIDFWMYAGWEIFAHLSQYYTPLKPVTLFKTLYRSPQIFSLFEKFLSTHHEAFAVYLTEIVRLSEYSVSDRPISFLSVYLSIWQNSLNPLASFTFFFILCTSDLCLKQTGFLSLCWSNMTAYQNAYKVQLVVSTVHVVVFMYLQRQHNITAKSALLNTGTQLK